MVKRYILIIVAALLFSSNSLAATFTWDQANHVCYNVCGGYVLVWRIADYEAICPQDVLEELTDCEADPVGCTEHHVPYPCQPALKTVTLAKIKVVPDGYHVTEMTIRKSNAPALEAGSRYVTVIIAFADENGKHFESDFSNRIVWKTPIAIKPFEILLEAP